MTAYLFIFNMEKSQEHEKIKIDPKRRTQYARAGGSFGIQFGKPVKFPNLKRTIFNTSRQELEDRRTKNLSQQKEKSINKSREKTLPRFTSQQNVTIAEEKKEGLPLINRKLIRHSSSQRLQRIKSQQNIVHQGTQMIGSYRVGGLIGKGSYASVRLVKSWKGGVYAMKIYQKNKLTDIDFKRNIEHQIKVLEKISHPNIIKYIETVYTNDSVNIIMEVVENNSLSEYLRMQPNKKISQRNAKIIIKDLLRGLSYLHENNIVHRDLKLQNILISKDMRIKLIDFGFSTFDTHIHYDFCGTPHYLSPQIIGKGGYTGQAADIWAIGVIVYKILTGNFPFQGFNDKMLYRKICRGEFIQSTGISFEAQQFILSTLNMDPSMRPSASSLLSHPWLEPTHSI